MKLFNKIIGSGVGAATALAAFSINAATVVVDQSTFTGGYMSWVPSAYTTANYPGDGGSGASGWGVSDLQASFAGTTLTLSPNVNTYAPGNSYWNNPDGSGANLMTASIYATATGSYVNTSVTFDYTVLANTLVAADSYSSDGYTAEAFIKDFGPGYSYNGGVFSAPLTVGAGSITYTLTGNNPGEIVQWGFQLVGPDANPATVASLGNVQIQTVPEPATISLLGMGLALPLYLIRRRK